MFRPCENNVKRLWISLQHFWWTLQRVWQVVRAPLRHGVRLVCACVLMLAVLRFDVPPPNNLSSNLDRMLAGRQFDFAGWWVHAFSNKVLQELTLWQNGMTEQQQVAYVRQHMRAIAQYQDLESQITQLFVDPHVADKTTATAALRAERDVLRVQLAAQQDLAEAILQEQVESVLREEGFAIGGQVLPPLRFRFTELPDIIIVSRRDRIDRIASRELQTGLTVDQQDKIEREVDARFDVSSLVSGIGGLGAYPTMLPETGALRWVLGVIAHEWTHNYFLYVLSPIGWNYSEDGKSRTMNETAANIVEREIGRRVTQRFYPDLAGELHMEEAEEAEEAEERRNGDGKGIGRARAGSPLLLPRRSTFAKRCARRVCKPMSCWPQARSTRLRLTWSSVANCLWQTATSSASSTRLTLRSTVHITQSRAARLRQVATR